MACAIGDGQYASAVNLDVIQDLLLDIVYWARVFVEMTEFGLLRRWTTSETVAI